jgi:hypothetical protein
MVMVSRGPTHVMGRTTFICATWSLPTTSTNRGTWKISQVERLSNRSSLTGTETRVAAAWAWWRVAVNWLAAVSETFYESKEVLGCFAHASR